MKRSSFLPSAITKASGVGPGSPGKVTVIVPMPFAATV
jgi:hypothetical protein